MRDIRKDKKYFEEYLTKADQRLLKFNEVLELGKIKFPNNKEKEREGNGFLLDISLYKLNALYSMGKEIDSIRKYYYEVVEYMKKGWNFKSYNTMLWMVSWGILLDASSKVMESLHELQSKSKKEDFLIDYLFHANNSNWKINTKELLFPKDFKTLQELVQLGDKEEMINKLKYYLENEWYKIYDDTGWHESHNHYEKIYSGYWSWESGAIAKILQLNDKDLKNLPYYPYDLVHYKGN
ncbi:PoNe immunity protein domain-containing protein [Listeria innocua]